MDAFMERINQDDRRPPRSGSCAFGPGMKDDGMARTLWNSKVLAVAAVLGGFVLVALNQSAASSGEWMPWNAPRNGLPLKNTRLRQQPRPQSAPVGQTGYAVELTGLIESAPPPRQPRPLSAAPTRLDGLVSTLPTSL